MISPLCVGLLVLLVSYVHTAKKDVQCGSNEQYTCGPSCIETCDYKPEMCSMGCLNGCFCNSGYVRQSNESGSPCIKLKDCKKQEKIVKCGINEEYNQCGSWCPPTCDDFNYPLPKDPQPCIELCKSGCFCKKDYYRAKNGKCVTINNCCTGKNEQYTDCGTACVETCDFIPDACTDQCVPGCFCKSTNYIRKDNSTASPCIKRNQCPNKHSLTI